MFLVFTLVLLSLGIGIFMSVYSAFFPFLQTIGHVTQYNSAYYSAISEVERGLLVVKYRDPGFEGSGGVLGSTGWGPMSDQDRTLVTGNDQGMWWNISSRTTNIPSTGTSTTDPLLQASDSSAYNAINYHMLETFLLYTDAVTGSESYYSGSVHSLSYFSGAYVTGVFRLPPVVVSGFAGSLLCADSSASLCDSDGDHVYDEAMINWSLGGLYTGIPFKIIPTVHIFYYSGMQINYPFDTTIRASVINNQTPIIFANSYSPIDSNGGSLSGQNVVSEQASAIQSQTFQNIFQNTDFTTLQLSFGLVSLLRSYLGSIYPYLEYRFDFPQTISDRFFTIDGHGRDGEYDVQIRVKKPTVPGSVGGGFTVIF